MRIAVIGGSGFVGTELIALLRKEHEIVNLDKRPSDEFASTTKIMDVRNTGQLNEALAGKDLVILLAAEHRDDVSPISLYYDVNVGGMRNVLAAMELNGIKKIVFTSTVALYGLDQEISPDENALVSPFNHYGKSKYKAEKTLREWLAIDNTRSALVIRPTVIFGPNNRGNVYNLFRQIFSGRFLMIGSGMNQKSMSYVKNVVSFIQDRIDKDFHGFELFNYSDKPDFSMNLLVSEIYAFKDKKVPFLKIPYSLGIFIGYIFDLLASIVRKKLPISSIRVKKFCASSTINADKVKESGFVPPYSLQQAIAHTLEKEFKE
jgi:nucleoside-diphosphate-sugar epimerase